MNEVTSKLRQNIWRLVILTIAGSMIYGLPYFRSYYYDAYMEVYHLTNSQMGAFGSIFGVMGAISYLFGGVVADIISPKKLMSISLILTGIGGLLHIIGPSFYMLVFIYLLWGFTSLFAFWPSLLKGLRQIANENEQSKAYGFMDGGRGIVNAVHLAITLAIFNFLSKAAGNLAGLNGVIIFYSAVCIILGILVFCFMKEEKREKNSEEKTERLNLKQIVEVVRMPAVWILSLILCCTYTMNILFYYFTPYATSHFGMTAAAGAVVTMLAQYIRPVAAFGGGIAADRVGRSKVLYVTFGLMAVCTFVILFSGNLSPAMFTVICALIYAGMYGGYSMVFSMMDEGGIPMKVSGTATGLICTIGYLPEVVCPFFAGKVLDTFSDKGYTYLFMFLGLMMILGIIFLIVWDCYSKYLKKRQA